MKIVFPYDGYESLGIGYLASISMQQGYEVDLHPLKFGDYIRGYSTQSIKNIEKEKNAILQLNPDIVAFSLNSFMAGSLIRLALSVNQSGIKTIAGGPHCTAEPVVTAETNAFNAVVAGEAENVFIPTIEAIYENNYNLPWLFTPLNKAANYVFSGDIDNFPFPAKKLFYNINSYEAKDYKIITSRGCPYNCIFCSHSNPKIKNKYRRRSIDNIIEELIIAKHSFGIKSVYFLDDIFTINEDWVRSFVKVYKQKINIPFHAISHPNNINEEIISLLKEGGCYAIRLGVQTTTEEIKRRIGRIEDNQKVIDAINNLKRKSIKVEIDHMVNLPGETLKEARGSLKFYNVTRPDSIKVYWLMPLPGTIWFNKSIEQNLITKEQALNIKNGKAFGKHSYLFYNKSFHCSKWLGIHFLLSWLPILPKAFVSLLIKIKADKFLRIPSFFLIVGVPRFLNMSGKWDMVGKEHIKRILFSIRKQSLTGR
jgi:anaerobic magnesium-protoporphyrin IX monomethyl ester cyclase